MRRKLASRKGTRREATPRSHVYNIGPPRVSGLLLPPGEIHAWRDAIIALAHDNNLRTKMAEQGRDWVEQQFSALVIDRQFTTMLQDGL